MNSQLGKTYNRYKSDDYNQESPMLPSKRAKNRSGCINCTITQIYITNLLIGLNLLYMAANQPPSRIRLEQLHTAQDYEHHNDHDVSVDGEAAVTTEGLSPSLTQQATSHSFIFCAFFRSASPHTFFNESHITFR